MNLQLSDLVIILALAACTYGWWRNITIREQALLIVKQHCKKLNLQLLDQSVAGNGWKPTWQHGTLCIKRVYRFEFTSTGASRYPGTITFLGNQQSDVWLSPHHL
ncbi:DUF3301 domain-containing protein [Marinomonas transparens]|uniref:DUF3301 domain-containing protein n=1 Tax=Marinomonas transparens TaxID=2795388 RepID=A0A934JRJ0_9GAMM|nr:DUF3301 domain-containing protein [Marinomonas transparens]MBJ7538518.1 DUF3301 domain-containing protein [Marinomonas transparens]